jgi:hypothetical protein
MESFGATAKWCSFQSNAEPLGEAPLQLSSYKRAEGSDSVHGMLGGQKKVSADHKDVQAAANAAVQNLSSENHGPDKPKLKEVCAHVTTAVWNVQPR